MAYGDDHVMRAHENVAPSVIDAPLEAAEDELPPTVYLPTNRASTDADVELELRDADDGNRALLVFTSLEQLVQGCGDGQPWVAVPGGHVDDIKARSGADVVLWDAALPVEDRRTRYQEARR
ncbi:SAV_915 family protein [Saccharopolyspora cebuensis]|uniref:SAV_915 family protein n=1 Tax=Saccharopolyspora cebuensis TaxID=418759 RepID=A0ABV4CF48_9PSEU